MDKQIKIALAGNPNCGKTTLFNALTGSNQFVGNWPGVTVEKKEGKLKKHDDVVIMDLPGIYSLSPYTLEEVVARNYLIGERPDAILNIIDGTNLERNLYLTTQLTELGIPVVIAVNMMDVVRKNGDQINVKELSRQLGCEIVEISALKGDGVMDAAEAAVKAAKGQTKTIPMHTFSGPVEHAIAHIEEAAVHTLPEGADKMDDVVQMTFVDAVKYLTENGFDAPDPADYGVWVPGIPVLVSNGLESAGAADWLSGLINDGIVAGVGAVLGFVPQMLVLFLMLAFLEACGYMARIAFVLDRVFRKFGLSGKSFIPMLIGVGCGVPGIMASRTIENERDRRMTVMTTTFIPCGAKVPFIAMIAGAIFGGSAWVSTSAYFIGMAAIIVSGIMLKKTKMFAGDPAPFVMELPAYHWPTLGNVLRSMWERGWSFIKKAGTIILLSTIFVWFTTYFGWVDGTFRMLDESEIQSSILAAIGGVIAWIFKPLGWGNWQAAVASITGLVAKENIVGTLGILYGGGDGTVYQNIGAAFTGISGFSFLVFNLLCAPCFAAIGAIKREMNNRKWTWFAIGYQCGFAYLISLMINQFGGLFTGSVNVIGLIFAVAALALMVYMLVRPYKEATKLNATV